MTNLNKVPCYSCASSGTTIHATIRIHKDHVLWPLYFCELHYQEVKKGLNKLGMFEWDIDIQADGFTRIEEPS